MAQGTRTRHLAASLPAEWRAAFCHFVETGEAQKSFLDFLGSNKEAQAAVEVIFNEQAAAFERLGAALRSVRAAPAIGAIESTGEHKSQIYGGIYPGDKKPIWFSLAPKSMNHFNAAAWAEEEGGSLPTRKQGDYLDAIKDQGAFKALFNRSGSFPAGSVWLAEHYGNIAQYQQLSNGSQNYDYYGGNHELQVLCVFR